MREALGADAVVLSNRTNEDGSVEIVALADTDLAALAPAGGDGSDAGIGAGAGRSQQHHSQRSPAAYDAQPSQALAAPTSNAAFANPYANGMPDVFSAVFGASPEIGANANAADARGFAPGAASLAAPNVTSARPSAFAARERHTDAKPAGTMPAARSATGAAEAAQTMAESNPWLIDHAQRLGSQQQRGDHATPAAHTAKTHAMTPAAAAAKGLGAPGKILSPEELASASLPDWAHEAAQVAARRAVPRVTPAFDGVGAKAEQGHEHSPDAATMADAVRARIEEVVSQTVMSELSSMRGMMEEQFAGLLWGERQRRNPVQGTLTKQLFAAGFSAQLVRMMVDNMPEFENVEAGMQWVQSVLGANLPVLENEDALMERGGVFALMGPTGVGKTTTTAKLAARCVMRFGASKVALLTTDSYRIGGHEQLRIFGKILGVSVHAVKDAADLQLALTELRNKHIVLIDTIGMSQRDRTVSDQIAMLCGAGLPVQRLLLLNATSHGDTLNEVVQAYRSAEGQPDLAGCILTKLDEATNLGGVLDAVIRYKLPVHYVSTGQKVPENLYVATRKFLIKSAFCIPRDHSPFVPHDDDIPALLSALSSRANADLHEVRFG